MLIISNNETLHLPFKRLSAYLKDVFGTSNKFLKVPPVWKYPKNTLGLVITDIDRFCYFELKFHRNCKPYRHVIFLFTVITTHKFNLHNQLSGISSNYTCLNNFRKSRADSLICQLTHCSEFTVPGMMFHAIVMAWTILSVTLEVDRGSWSTRYLSLTVSPPYKSTGKFLKYVSIEGAGLSIGRSIEPLNITP